MRKFLRLFGVIFALLTIFIMSACGQNGTGTETTFVIDRTSLKMSVGDVYSMSWSVVPTPAEPSTVSWVSSDTDVATCEGGVVRATGEGRAIITATHSSGRYEVCSVTVENGNKKLYMLEGESISVKKRDINVALDGAECISTGEDVATISENDDGIIINALRKGKCEIRLATEKSSIIYYDLIVLSAENSGVNIETDEVPLTVNYDNGRYKSAVKITEISVEKYDTREFLDDRAVGVELIFKFQKVYDSDGDDANNLTQFVIEVYSAEAEELIREIAVNTGWMTVSSGETKEFVYNFYADLEVGDGERSFTFLIKEVDEKE